MKYDSLLAAAERACSYAYAPYSRFSVGAAVLDELGQTFVGCNIENLSFGLTICAERVAIGAAIAAGSRRFEAVAIVSASNEPTVPCGACRQVLAEFNATLRVISRTLHGEYAEFDLATLLPRSKQGILTGST